LILVWYKRLIVRIGAAVLFIEIVALAAMGWWYTGAYGRQVDSERAGRLAIPAKMMAMGLLTYDAVEDGELLQRVLGEPVEEAVVFGGNGVVFNSLRPERLRQKAFEFIGISPDQLNSVGEAGFRTSAGGDAETIAVHVQPLKGAGGQATFAFLYLQVRSSGAAREKAMMASRFLLGSTVMVAATTLALLLVYSAQVGRRLQRLLGVTNRVREGDMNARIKPDGGLNEMTLLSADFNTMLNAIQERDRRMSELSNLQQAILDHADYSIISTDTAGTILTFNRAAEKMLGYPAVEMVGKATPEIFHVEDEVAARARIFSHELGEKINPGYEVFVAKARKDLPNEHEWTYVRKNGERISVYLSVTALKNETGEIYGFIGVGKDISEQKLREQEIEQITAIIETTSDFVGVADASFKVVYVNPAGLELAGYSDECAITGLDVLTFHPRTTFEHVLQPAFATLDTVGSWSGESVLLTRQGEEIPVSQVLIVHRDGAGKVLRYSTIIRDIRSIKQSAAELHKSRERLESAVGLARLGSWEHDLGALETRWSREMYSIYGVPEDFTPPGDTDSFLKLIHPDDRELVSWANQEAVNQRSAINYDYRTNPEIGPLKHLACRIYALRDAAGNPVSISGTLQDITERKVAELALKDSEEKHRLVVGALVEGVNVLDLNGAIVTSNESAERILGLTSDQLRGKSTYDPDWQTVYEDGTPFPPEDYPINRTLRTGTPLSGVIMGVHKPTGELTWISINSAPLTREGETSAYAVVASFFDVTKEKAAQFHLLERSRQLELDAEISRVISGSRALPAVMQLCVREITKRLGCVFCGVWLLDDSHDEMTLLASDGRVSPDGDGWRTIQVGRFKVGRIARARKAILSAPVDGSASPDETDWENLENSLAFAGYPLIAGGRLLGVVALLSQTPFTQFTTDSLALMVDHISLGVTRKLGEEEISRLNLELEHRVIERTRELKVRISEVENLNRSMINVLEDLRDSRAESERAANQLSAANVKLTSANNELESFSYSVSHDLRAPLRNVAGFVDLLRKRLGSQMDASVARYLKIVQDETHRMGQLIDDLLGLSRLGRAHLKLEPLKMRTLVDEVIASLPPPENGCAIEWEIGELPGARGDAGLIRQVWTNLISNAAKYSRSREPARIRIGGYVDNTADHRLVYFVADNGVGFDMKYQEKLFGVFQRLHSNEEFEGTGIGLANVHRIVTRHGGQVWAEGAVDEGATFYFSLRNPESSILGPVRKDDVQENIVGRR